MNKLFLLFLFMIFSAAHLFSAQAMEMLQIVNQSSNDIIYSFKFNDDVIEAHRNMERRNIYNVEVIENGEVIDRISTLMIRPQSGVHSFVLYSEIHDPNRNLMFLSPDMRVVFGTNVIDHRIIIFNLPSHRRGVSYVQALQRLFEFITIYDHNGNVIMTFNEILEHYVFNTRVIRNNRRDNDFFVGLYYRIIITDEIINRGRVTHSHLESFSGKINNHD